MKHTKGPWELDDSGNYIIGDTEADKIFTVADIGHTYNQEANAALIAAAPEMLEALEIIKDQLHANDVILRHKTDHYLVGILLDVESLIRKAKGGE